MAVQQLIIHAQFEYLRRGANSQNIGLVSGSEKGKGKGKKNLSTLPVLQVGADPYSDVLRLT